MVHVGETVHMAHGTCGGDGAYGTWYMWGRRCIWHMVHVGETVHMAHGTCGGDEKCLEEFDAET